MWATLLGLAARHALTGIGGALVTGGYLTSSDSTAISGGVLAAGGVIWSIINKRYKLV